MKKLFVITIITLGFNVFANNPASQFGDFNTSHTSISHAHGR